MALEGKILSVSHGADGWTVKLDKTVRKFSHYSGWMDWVAQVLDRGRDPAKRRRLAHDVRWLFGKD